MDVSSNSRYSGSVGEDDTTFSYNTTNTVLAWFPESACRYLIQDIAKQIAPNVRVRAGLVFQ